MSFLKKYARILIPIGLVIICIILFSLFKSHLNIGGLFGKLFGHDIPEQRTTVVDGRVDDSGNIILPGQSDNNGFTQAPAASSIENPGFFSNPNTITVTSPTDGKQKIELPTGVKNRDVGEITRIRPNVHEKKNNDRPSVDLDQVLGFLE